MYLSFSLSLSLYLSLSLSFCWLGHVFSWPPSDLRGWGFGLEGWKALNPTQWQWSKWVTKVGLELLGQLKKKYNPIDPGLKLEFSVSLFVSNVERVWWGLPYSQVLQLTWLTRIFHTMIVWQQLSSRVMFQTRLNFQYDWIWCLFDRRMGKAQKDEPGSMMVHHKVMFIQGTGLLSAHLVSF